MRTALTPRFESRGDAGFTLVELLVVIIVIGILMAVAVPSYLAFQQRANSAAAQANVRAAAPALEAYFADNETYVGISYPVLAASYDAGLAPLSFSNLSTTSYCVESSVGSATFSRNGPDAPIVAGAC